MSLDPENDFRSGDLGNDILRKILARLSRQGEELENINVSVTNVPSITAEDPLFIASSTGFVNGKAAKAIHVISRRAGFNSTTVLQDVAEFLGTSIDLMPELTGSESLEIVSSNAGDAPLGSGAHTVRVAYIDTSNNLVTSAPITLNGLTAVPLAFKSKQILWMEVGTVGVNTVATGNIVLRVVGPNTVHEQITAGGNRSLSSHFMVPAGYSAYIPSWHVTAVGNATQDARLRATVNGADRTISGAYVFQDNTFANTNASGAGTLPWLKYPELTKIKVSTISTAAQNTNRIDADYTILLVAN